MSCPKPWVFFSITCWCPFLASTLSRDTAFPPFLGSLLDHFSLQWAFSHRSSSPTLYAPAITRVINVPSPGPLQAAFAFLHFLGVRRLNDLRFSYWPFPPLLYPQPLVIQGFFFVLFFRVHGYPWAADTIFDLPPPGSVVALPRSRFYIYFGFLNSANVLVSFQNSFLSVVLFCYQFSFLSPPLVLNFSPLLHSLASAPSSFPVPLLGTDPFLFPPGFLIVFWVCCPKNVLLHECSYIPLPTPLFVRSAVAAPSPTSSTAHPHRADWAPVIFPF